MIISSSAVSMNSTHSKAQIQNSITSTVMRQGDNVQMSVQSQGSLSASMQISTEARAKLAEQRELLSDLKKEAEKKNFQSMASRSQSAQIRFPDFQSDADHFNFQALRKILETLGMFKKGAHRSVSFESESSKAQTLRLQLQNINASTSSATNAASNVWERTTQTSNFTYEAETTTFSTQGIVRTSDGREISFGVELEMSREFLEVTEFVSHDTVKIMTDPLVINMDVATADVTDQKFYFDINADGKEDEISSLSEGSGFLALDKNNDGTINDGHELFGARTGDGFLELSEYDSDMNGWIDENDDVFKALKVWTKDKDGNDKLLTLLEADVGAIYLGNASTEFSINQADTNETNAQIRKTGVYLRESGGAGTVQHVDFAL